MADAQPPSAGDMTHGAITSEHSATEVAKQHNLLAHMVTNLDRHLVFPLLSHAEEETPEDEDTTDITRL